MHDADNALSLLILSANSFMSFSSFRLHFGHVPFCKTRVGLQRHEAAVAKMLVINCVREYCFLFPSIKNPTYPQPCVPLSLLLSLFSLFFSLNIYRRAMNLNTQLRVGKKFGFP